MQQKKILKSFISIGSYQKFITEILKLSEEKSSSYISISNVHMTIEVYRDEKFEKVVNHSDITTPDGMPLAKAIKLFYGINQERVAGMDLMPDLMKRSEELGKSIFLYGSTNEILSIIKKKSQKEFPSLKLEIYSPPFRELNDIEKNEIIHQINDFNPDFVFVALGCPKQEKWMAEHKGIINSCMLGLGGVFEVYAGVKNRAPLWMQNNSLEWLYRLIQDPKRLWKRYLYTNSLFIILLLKQLLLQKLKK